MFVVPWVVPQFNGEVWREKVTMLCEDKKSHSEDIVTMAYGRGR